MKKALLLILGAALLSGCTYRVVDLTVASTKNYNLNGNDFVKGSRVTGEDAYPVVVFPLGIPNIKEATDIAIENNPCAVALSDVVVTQYNYSFFFGVYGVTVEGDLILDRTKPGCENIR